MTDDLPYGDAITVFCRLVSARSESHQFAIQLLYHNGLFGESIGVLRQELDSLIRLIYLSHSPRDVRQSLISQSLRGQKWRVGRRPITDHAMVEFAATLGDGWERMVYQFGCAFIHLSNAHDFLSIEPYHTLSMGEKDMLQQYLNSYHGRPEAPPAGFLELADYILPVFEKVRSNLHHYLERLADPTPK